MQLHHRAESTAYFPQFQAIEPRLSRGFDLLETDHREIDRILFELAEAGRTLRAVINPSGIVPSGPVLDFNAA
jgi:hypothetical protein